MLPVIGARAYLFMVVLPEYRRTVTVNRAQARIGRTLNPERTYRALKVELETVDTINMRRLLAQECLRLGKYDEALTEYTSLAMRRVRKAQVRRMWLLERLGRHGEAATLAADVVGYIKRSPKFARQQQNEWLSAAQTYLRNAKAI